MKKDWITKEFDKLEREDRVYKAKCACGHLGSMIAITISWSLNKSILWALLHGICGWFYVIYYYFWIKK